MSQPETAVSQLGCDRREAMHAILQRDTLCVTHKREGRSSVRAERIGILRRSRFAWGELTQRENNIFISLSY